MSLIELRIIKIGKLESLNWLNVNWNIFSVGDSALSELFQFILHDLTCVLRLEQNVFFLFTRQWCVFFICAKVSLFNKDITLTRQHNLAKILNNFTTLSVAIVIEYLIKSIELKFKAFSVKALWEFIVAFSVMFLEKELGHFDGHELSLGLILELFYIFIAIVTEIKLLESFFGLWMVSVCSINVNVFNGL